MNEAMARLNRTFLPAVLATLGAFLVGGLMALLVGESPLLVYRTLFVDTLGSLDSLGYVCFNATPLIFTGLAVAIGFQAGLFNIGCEGQLYVGAIATAWVALRLAWLPAIILFPLCVVGAMMAGGIWGAIPGWLKVRFGAHEVINTIMMNFVAIGLVDYIVLNILKEPGELISQTAEVPSKLHLPRLASWIPGLPPSQPLEVSFLFALGIAVLLWWFLRQTVLGYELRMIGLNREAAVRGGISEVRIVIAGMAISGALASLVGLWDVLGYHYRFVSGFSSGWGFLGIAVALVARNHPLGVMPVALFFGILSKGALDLELFTAIPRELVLVIEALAILFLLLAERWRSRQSF